MSFSRPSSAYKGETDTLGPLWVIKQLREAASQRLLAKNVRETAPKISKLEHKMARKVQHQTNTINCTCGSFL